MFSDEDVFSDDDDYTDFRMRYDCDYEDYRVMRDYQRYERNVLDRRRVNVEEIPGNDVPDSARSLSDLSARVAAKNYSYSYVESFYSRIPEPFARKLMLWSFPRHKSDLVKHFGLLPSGKNFEDVMQIGFQVSGCYKVGEERWDVALYIDRCVITAASCSCLSVQRPCGHIAALALYRYENADNIPMHLPISDSLSALNRDQLLYLVKFVISKYSNFVLGSAQQITNELLDENSEKNAQPGAPDPTAGGDTNNEPVWLN